MWHHHVDLLAYHDLDGRSGFKLALHEAGGRFFLYVAGFCTATGTGGTPFPLPRVTGLGSSRLPRLDLSRILPRPAWRRHGSAAPQSRQADADRPPSPPPGWQCPA
jgi:hypothetical protein